MCRAGVNICIRSGCIEDIPELENIESECFDSSDYSLKRRQFRYLLSRSGSTFYVALLDSVVVGYICVIYYLKSARLYSIAVSRSVQGMGIASKLIGKAEEAVRMHGKTRFFLEVKVNNPAISLYTKSGFDLISKIDNYYIDGSIACKMMKLL
ncbi:MAG: GNAT family N-acetyltransferase [Methanosarcinaceae archaeon]|nr:GNAT family N-acetyltransferase [Methanosarcinaceae archaeon]